MDKKCLSLISSLVSLGATMCLLVVSVFGWYVTNNTASATGVTGSTANSNFIDNVEVKRYKATVTKDENSFTYTWNGTEATKATCMYSLLENYNRIVYVISYETTQDKVSLSIRNKAGTRTNLFEKDSDGNYYNYLSNVATFYLIENPDISGTTYSKILTSSDEIENTIQYSYESDTTQYTISDVASNSKTEASKYYFYIAFDYNSDTISTLYSDNLGTSVDSITYKEDIEFVLT